MFEDQLLRWHAQENAARTAEDELRRMGQGAASPEFAALALKAKALREEADKTLKDLLAVVPKSLR